MASIFFECHSPFITVQTTFLRDLAAIAMLDTGAARVAEKIDGAWHVHQWLKKAVLLSFRLTDNRSLDAGYSRFYDKVPLKYADYSDEQFAADGVRVVEGAQRLGLFWHHHRGRLRSGGLVYERNISRRYPVLSPLPVVGHQ